MMVVIIKFLLASKSLYAVHEIWSDRLNHLSHDPRNGKHSESKRMKKRRIECSIRRLRQGLTSSIPLTYIPLARRSVVLKSSQAAGSAISGQGLSSPQRAAEKWGQPLGMQAARENTYSTPSTLPCAA